MRVWRLTRMASVLVLALSAGLLVTSANAGIRDGRSPDTKDAAYLAHLDGRSPDTIDAAAQAHATPPAADLRSPDTKDAAAAAHSTPAASIVVISNGGFDWTDAGIGAAGGFAIALIVGGVFLLSNRGSREKLAV
jgi:hypothetical protein